MSQENQKHRWAVILARGDGTRLKILTRAIDVDDRPKQFRPDIGESASLEKTQRRMALLLNRVQTSTIVTRSHERFYRNHLKHWAAARLPAPAIFLSLFRVRQLSPEAVVAFFPSDHHFADVSCFISRVALTFDAVEAHASSITLRDIQPDDSQQNCGWIVPVVSPEQLRDHRLSRVRLSWEKPPGNVAHELMPAASLWNTIVRHVDAFLDMISRAVLGLYHTLSSARGFWDHKLRSKFLQNCISIPFRRTFHKKSWRDVSCDLSVLKFRNVGWTDLGKPQRPLSVSRLAGDCVCYWPAAI